MKMADIKILSTHAVQEVLRELGPLFERASGFSLAIDYDPANALKRRIEDGTAFDVVIATRPVVEALARQGKVHREACTDIGRSGLGIAVRQGTAKPDITTVDAFKRALLAARSLVRSKEGTSGLYFETLLDRLGIADAVHDKIVLGPSGRIAELVDAEKRRSPCNRSPSCYR
jgi:molybdate transport system substrate-binding protein